MQLRKQHVSVGRRPDHEHHTDNAYVSGSLSLWYSTVDWLLTGLRILLVLAKTWSAMLLRWQLA